MKKHVYAIYEEYDGWSYEDEMIGICLTIKSAENKIQQLEKNRNQLKILWNAYNENLIFDMNKIDLLLKLGKISTYDCFKAMNLLKESQSNPIKKFEIDTEYYWTEIELFE